MSRHYLWLSARSWIVLLFSTAVSFVAVSVGSGYASQLISFDRGLGGIRGGDFNYCRLSGKTTFLGTHATYGCMPEEAAPGGNNPTCPNSAVAHTADAYSYYTGCTDDPDINNDEECDGPNSLYIWSRYACNSGSVKQDRQKKLNQLTDTWDCTKPVLDWKCINCTNGTLQHTETVDEYDCIADDPE